MKALICGGGIGGCTLALSLHAVGVQVELFEAAAEMRELGVGINLLPHAVRELTELGLDPELRRVGVATTELAMFTKLGQHVWTEPRGRAAGYRWPQYSIHRGRLHRLLYQACRERVGPERLHTGQEVVSASQSLSYAEIQLAGGARVRGDLIVGADGIHSAIRSQLYGDEGPPLWNGQAMWRGIARHVPFLTGRSMVMIGHFGHRAVVYPISARDRGGRAEVNLVLEAQLSEGGPVSSNRWRYDVDRGELRARFSDMRFDWIDLVSLIDAAPRWWCYPMVDRDPLPRWSFGRVTLLGDAAHPMYPVGSNGASQAIIDARTLARELVVQSGVEAALSAYETRRRPTTTGIVESNRRVEAERCLELAHARAPEGFARVEDVFAPGELAELSLAYKRTAGFDPARLNARPSLGLTGAGSPG